MISDRGNLLADTGIFKGVNDYVNVDQAYAKKNDETVFTQSIFPEVLKKVAQDCYMNSMDAFSKLFEDTIFYNTVMDAIAKEAYRDLRSR